MRAANLGIGPRMPARRSASARRAGALLALFACGCTRDLVLPEEPKAEPPTIATFSPEAGFSGAKVNVRGASFAGPLEQIQIRFGDSPAVHPDRILDGGRALEVTVPEDARPGRIAVVTPAGRADSAKPFAFSGAGHLRKRRLLAEATFHARLRAAFPVGGSRLLAWESTLEVAALVTPLADSTVTRLLPLAHVASVGRSESTGELAVLALAPREPSCEPSADPACRPFTATLGLYDEAGLAAPSDTDPPQPRQTLSFPARGLDSAPPMAFDPTGRRVLVVADEGLYVVELEHADVSFVPAPHDLGWPAAAWVTATEFAVLEGTGLRLFEVAGGGPTPGRFLDFATAVSAPFVSLATDGRGRLAAGTALGEVLLVDALHEGAVPQVFQPPMRDPSWSLAGGLAFSHDGRTLVVAHTFLSEVFTWDVSGEVPRPWHEFHLDVPSGVSCDARGLCYVAALGGTALVSTASGLSFEWVPLVPELLGPQLRTIQCRGESRTVLEVGLAALDRVWRLSPTSLEEVSDCGRVGLPTGAGRLRRLVATPGGGSLFAQYEPSGALYRFGPGTDAPPEGPWLPPSKAPQSELSRIPISPGGTMPIAFSAQESPGAEFRQLLAVVDGTRAWPPVSVPLLDLSSILGEPLFGKGIALTDERLVLAERHGLRIVDLGEAKLGRVQDAVPEVVFPEASIDDVDVVGDFAFASVRTLAEGVGRMEVVRLRDGTVIDGARFERSFQDVERRVSPGGRRLYLLELKPDSVQLASLPLDPETGAVGPEEPPIPVAPGTNGFIWYPDGEHLLTVDPGGRLMLFE